MSKVRDISNLSNVIRTDASGNVSFVSGSTTLATLNTSGQLSGSSPVLSSSYALNADLLDGLDSTQFTLTSSFAAQTASFTAFTASILSYTASQLVLNGTYATTGSNTFAGIQTINSNLVVTGSITAQTLVVQTITSSVDFVTGSTRFGSILANTHVFTGSVSTTGSITVSGRVYGTTTGLNSDFDSGGIISYSSGSTLKYIQMGYDQSGNYGWIQALEQGTAYKNLTLNAAGGNVGIGTTSPFAIASTNLSVNGASSAIQLGVAGVRNAQFYADGAEVRLYAVTNVPLRFGTNDTERMRLDISGSLGLGVTPSAWISTAKAFQLGNTAALYAPSSEAILSNNVFVDSTDNNKYITTNYATQYRQVNGQHIFYTAASGTAGNTITFTSPLTIASTGAATFSNSFTTSDTAALFLSPSLSANNTTFLQLGKNIADTYNSGEMSFKYVGNGSTSNMVSLGFYGAGNKLNVLGNGNVGIGTSNPQTKLHITAASATTSATLLTIDGGEAGFSDTNDSNTAYSINFDACVYSGAVGIAQRTGAQIQMLKQGSWNEGAGAPGSYGNLVFKTNNGTAASPNLAERMRISSGGDVGIGTTGSTGNRLFIKGSSTSSANTTILAQNSAGTNSFYVRDDGAVFLRASYPFTTGASSNMYLDSSGVIQLSVSSLKYKTDVIDYDKGLDYVLKLRAVSYKSKNSLTDGDKRYAGFIAEEIDELGLNEFVVYAEDNTPNALAYSNMVALLTKAIQELKAENDTLKEILQRNNIQ
jgi:hypothetical protein